MDVNARDLETHTCICVVCRHPVDSFSVEERGDRILLTSRCHGAEVVREVRRDRAEGMLQALTLRARAHRLYAFVPEEDIATCA